MKIENEQTKKVNVCLSYVKCSFLSCSLLRLTDVGDADGYGLQNSVLKVKQNEGLGRFDFDCWLQFICKHKWLCFSRS